MFKTYKPILKINKFLKTFFGFEGDYWMSKGNTNTKLYNLVV